VAEASAVIKTGTYEIAVKLSKCSDADGDGYENEAGPTSHPYEDVRKCIPEPTYSNTMLLNMLAEDD
jgi:hypothetical protein